MKLQNFLIGLGVFSLFSIIIFGAINTNDENSPYSEKYLNITHDSNTSKVIGNISSVGTTVKSDYQGISGDMGNFSSGEAEPSESNLVGSALRVLINLPKAWTPVTNVLKMLREQFQIPAVFTEWALAAIIIIIILILLASFLKNPLRS